MMSNSDTCPQMKIEDSETPVINERRKKERLIGGIGLISVAGIAMISGFAASLGMERKKDPSSFSRPATTTAPPKPMPMPLRPATAPPKPMSMPLPESGVALASRALMWGTIYAVGGFSAFCFIVWKLMGVHSLDEFRDKIQKSMPKIPKKEQQGKSDFKTVRELVNYLIEEDEKEKSRKK